MADNLNLETRIERRDDLLASELSGDELVALDVTKGSYFGFEGVAKTIWEALEQPRTLHALVAHVREIYEAAPESVDVDVISFVQELLDASLVEATA